MKIELSEKELKYILSALKEAKDYKDGDTARDFVSLIIKLSELLEEGGEKDENIFKMV